MDWTFVGRGAAFLEMALLVPWLLQAGHTPAEAELWVSQFPAWTSAAPTTIDLFAHAFADKWQANLATNNETWALDHASAAQRWASHRHAHTASP